MSLLLRRAQDDVSAADDALQSSEDADGRYLVDYSPQDRPWDTHRGQCDDVGRIYAISGDFERYAVRMSKCSGVLSFAWQDDPESGESRLRLRGARFCRVRHCPVCQWRRSLMWQARFYSALPELVGRYPTARWVFLTLTVRNCTITDLRATLQSMNDAWRRLVLRPEFRPVLGWVRTTEVTRGRDSSAHPHFHCLLMVRPSYFTHSYTTQARWVKVWQECMRVDYTPIVDVRTVKSRKGQIGDSGDPTDMLRGAAAEVLKYGTKPSDMTADDDWFLELTRQTRRLRFIATGGALKDVLRIDEPETDSEMVFVDGEAANDQADPAPLISFEWRSTRRKYQRRDS